MGMVSAIAIFGTFVDFSISFDFSNMGPELFRMTYVDVMIPTLQAKTNLKLIMLLTNAYLSVKQHVQKMLTYPRLQ